MKSISQTLTRRLLADISSVKRRQALIASHPEEADALSFPDLPGARSDRTNPALELVKAICEVFALSTEHVVQVGILKRNLLDLLSVREFAPEAAFRNPCESITVPMVICKRCNAIRDVDLCRDPDRLPSVDPETGEMIPPPRKSWVCHVSGPLKRASSSALISVALSRRAVALTRRSGATPSTTISRSSNPSSRWCLASSRRTRPRT
jgi:DNA polymerase epsilon subunit 1